MLNMTNSVKRKINTPLKIIKMAELKYTLIDTREQYNDYCDQLEQLVVQDDPKLEAEIRLLTHLIETWDREHSSPKRMAPVELLQYLMNEHSISASELARKLGRGKSLLSDILSYRKSFSKEMIRDLAAYFKVSQEGFNREYALKETKPNTVQLVYASPKRSPEVWQFQESAEGKGFRVAPKGGGPVRRESRSHQLHEVGFD